MESSPWKKCGKLSRALPLDKCPGSDRFLARFFIVCWDIIKVDAMAVFKTLIAP
jgi:hypothetical protein